VAAPVLEDAYLAYEVRLLSAADRTGSTAATAAPFSDVGSHRIYFLEITAIQLRQDIADGIHQIRWRSLPVWRGHAPSMVAEGRTEQRERQLGQIAYRKSYTADYRFPSSATVAFERDYEVDGMAVKELPPDPVDQVEVDNDRARWPCFFPSSVGMITAWAQDGRPVIMPCGSTTVVSRHPLVISPCVSYSAINERYALRASFDIIAQSGRFGCGVPFFDRKVLDAIAYLGNVSSRQDRDKFVNGGLTPIALGQTPVSAELPVHFDCRLVGHRDLGTHRMLFGEVERIFLRRDLTAQAPLEWCPIAEVVERAAVG
jgi:flavin reductase (DIM6/NTAB) family NADH-FMN oxidoreductase RutF